MRMRITMPRTRIRTTVRVSYSGKENYITALGWDVFPYLIRRGMHLASWQKINWVILCGRLILEAHKFLKATIK